MGHKGHYPKGKKETHKGTYCRRGDRGRMGHKRTCAMTSLSSAGLCPRNGCCRNEGAEEGLGTHACHDFTFFRRSLPSQWLLQKYIHSTRRSIPHIYPLPSFPLKFDINFESLEVEPLLSIRSPKFNKTFTLHYTSL